MCCTRYFPHDVIDFVFGRPVFGAKFSLCSRTTGPRMFPPVSGDPSAELQIRRNLCNFCSSPTKQTLEPQRHVEDSTGFEAPPADVENNRTHWIGRLPVHRDVTLTQEVIVLLTHI